MKRLQFPFQKETQLLSNSESIDFNDLLGKWIDSRFQKRSAGGFFFKTNFIQQTKRKKNSREIPTECKRYEFCRQCHIFQIN